MVKNSVGFKLMALVIMCGVFVGCGVPQDTVPTTSISDDTSDIENDTLSKAGSFSSVNPYTVRGDAELFFNSVTNTYSLIMSDFTSSNGPDVRVYLSQGPGVSNFIDLGFLKSTNGEAIRYDFSGDRYDPNFDHVLIWCEDFSVTFGRAPLTVQ